MSYFKVDSKWFEENSVEENNLMYKECDHFCDHCVRKEECNSLSEDVVNVKKLAMISQGMNDKTDEEILKVRNKAIDKLNELGYDVINSFFNDTEKMNNDMEIKNVLNKSVYYLSNAIECLSKVSVIYFCKGWENYRGCKIEHTIATEYGIPIIYEE